MPIVTSVKFYDVSISALRAQLANAEAVVDLGSIETLRARLAYMQERRVPAVVREAKIAAGVCPCDDPDCPVHARVTNASEVTP